MLMLQPQRETDDAMRQRVHGVLEEIWENEAKDKQGMYCDLIQTVLSITCHSGVIQRIFEITSHIPRPLPVGAILPMMDPCEEKRYYVSQHKRARMRAYETKFIQAGYWVRAHKLNTSPG